MSFFDEVETTVANCFPEDHEVFTEHGFLSLAAIQQYFARNRSLNVACFVGDSLEFHSITEQQLTVATGEHTLVCIESAFHGLSLTPTSNHRMYVKPAGSAAADAPYSIQSASSLTAVERVAFQGVFAQGHTAGTLPPSQLPFVAALSLTTDAHVEAFVWLYGYWLGAGWLDGDGAKVKLGPNKKKEVEELDAVFAALPLNQGTDWTRADAADANGEWDYTISTPAWWQYFAEQYGHQYSGGAAFVAALAGAHRRGSGVPKGRYTAAVAADEVAAPLKKAEPHVLDQTVSEETPPDAEDVDSAKWFFYWYGYMPPRLLRVMVAGLRFAGGNESLERAHGGVIYTSSVVFREQLVDVCIRAGYSVTIQLHVEAGQQMGVNNHGVPIIATTDGWHVQYTDFALQAQPVVETRLFRQEKIQGTVWCVTVPTKDQLILVRRVLETAGGVVRKASRAVVCGNTRFLQAIEDNGPIVLQFKPISQLHEVERVTRPRVTIDFLLRPGTTAEYLFKQYLCSQKSEDAVHILTRIQEYRKRATAQRRATIKQLYDDLPLLSASSSSSSPPAAASSAASGSAYLVPEPAAAKQNYNGVVPVAPAPATPSPPCLEHVLASPPANLPCAAHLAAVAQPELAALYAAYSANSPPPTNILEPIYRHLRDKLAEHVEGFLASTFFLRLVQLEEYAAREPKLSEFRIFRVLGRGAFGAVSAVQKIDTHAVYAMKEMGKKQVKADQSEWMVINERKVLAKMNSPFVLGLKYSFHDADTLFLIFDMCAGGDLKFHLRGAKDKCFESDRAKFYIAEVLLGLQSIHSLDIIYRDLKPNNILLKQDGHVIISDLGLTIKLRKNKVLKHLAGCLRADQLVLLADGVTTVRADQVRQGAQLAGEHGPVTVEEATPNEAALPSTSNFYRVTHADASSYVVTGDAAAMHLVTVRYQHAVTLETRAHGRTHVMFFAGVFDPSTGRRCEYGHRPFRASEDDPDSSHDVLEVAPEATGLAATMPTLVRPTVADCEAAMWQAWEHEEMADSTSLPGRAPTLGTFVDLPVVTLAKHASWWREDVEGRSEPFFRGVRLASPGVAPLAPAHGHAIPVGWSGPASDRAESKAIRPSALLVLKDAVGHISYRLVQPGDVVRVAVCLHHPLKVGSDKPDAEIRGRALLNLEHLLQANRIPLNEAGGLVIVSLDGEEADEKGAVGACSDEVVLSQLATLLRELGARKIVSCGAVSNDRWQRSVARVSGVADVTHVGSETRFTFAGRPGEQEEEAGSAVTVIRAPHPAIDKHLAAVSESILQCYGVSAVAPLSICSISSESTSARFAPFQVSGNGRYRLGDGTLTHNTAGYWSPEVVSKTGTYKVSDYWSLGVMLYEMLTGKRPNCTCDKKTKQWCPFSQKRNMEENAVDPEGVLHLDIEYPPDKISPEAKDFLQKLFRPDPAERLGAGSIDELLKHEYFADIDWDALACLAVPPPFVPDGRTVNANSIGEVGEFNKTSYKAIQITPEDNKLYEDFQYISPEGVQLELVEALAKMDNPDSKNNPANEQRNENATGCCVIL